MSSIVSNFSGSSEGYEIDFTISDARIFDTEPPQLTKVEAEPVCGTSQVILNFSENVLCKTVEVTDFKISGGSIDYQVTNVKMKDCKTAESYGRVATFTVSPSFQAGESLSLDLIGEISDVCGNLQKTGKVPFNTAKVFDVTALSTKVCEGNPTEIEVNVTGSTSPYKYSFIGDENFRVDNTSENKQSYTFSKAGTYRYMVTVEDKNGCKSTKLDSVSVSALPVAEFATDSTGYLSYNFKDSSSPAFTYRWDFGDGEVGVGAIASHVYADPGAYSVKLEISTEDGCIDSITHLLKVLKKEETNFLYIPSAFSPNGDGQNEHFDILSSGVKLFSLKIFNRWGQLVFESDDSQKLWDGKYTGGNDEPITGTYIYIVKAEFQDGNSAEQHGVVTVSK